MKACAAILNGWIDDTPWMPRVHDQVDVERHYRESVFAARDIVVADCGGVLAGFISLSDDHHVTGFYVDSAMRGSGYGKALLDCAKSKHRTVSSCGRSRPTAERGASMRVRASARSGEPMATMRKVCRTFCWNGGRS